MRKRTPEPWETRTETPWSNFIEQVVVWGLLAVLALVVAGVIGCLTTPPPPF